MTPKSSRRVTVTDWMMLALALVSVGLLTYEVFGSPSAETTRQILLTDYVIIGIFALEFLFRWVKDDRPKSFAFRQWYELVGMVPVASPVVRGFRLFRFLRIFVILSRFGRAADRAFGDEFTYRVIRRFKNSIADALAGTITLRVLDETESVLMKGKYASNLANSLEAKAPEMEEIILEKLKADEQMGRIRHIPFFDEIVSSMSTIVQRIAIDLLRDARVEAMIRETIRENTTQIRLAIREKDQA